MAERAPQPRGGDQEVEARALLELLVLGREQVAAHGVGHVGVDVEGGGAGGPVARALLPADRPPREGHALELEHLRPLGREIHRRMAPAQRVARRLGRRVGQHRERVRLHVPEGVPVVAAAREALGRDRPVLRPGARLQDVEEREADGLLEREVAVELDVRPVPEVVEVLALRLAQAVPAGPPRGRERRLGLVAQRRQRALARPAVGQQLDDAQRLPGLQLRADRHAREVGLALGRGVDVVRAVEDVVHPRRHPQLALLGAVDQRRAQVVDPVVLADERGAQRGRRPRVVGLAGHGLVGDELGLHDDARGRLERLDLVADRRDRALDERHEPRRADADALAGGRDPLDLAAQHAVAQVEHALVPDQPPVAHVERLVVDEQPDQLAVGDVDDRLALLGIAVAGLRVGQRALLEEGVEERAGRSGGLALVEVAAQADVPVGQREDRLALRQQLVAQLALAHEPGLDREDLLPDHPGLISSSRS